MKFTWWFPHSVYDARMSGAVAHFEVPVDNADRAGAFYREAFGWTITSMPEMDYTLVYTTPSDRLGMPKDPGAINGGLMKRDKYVKHPVITVAVDDLDAALTNVEKLGGTIQRGRFEVGDMGSGAYITDTEGNTIGLWQSAQP